MMWNESKALAGSVLSFSRRSRGQLRKWPRTGREW